MSVGCSSLNFLRPHEKPPEKVDSPPVETAGDPPRLPYKFSFRIAPYLFLSDFEIQRDQPLFAELAELRDHVYKELLLPPSSTPVQVYLFQTEERTRIT